MMRFRPGQALSEKEIADRFGVSRQPVREAFIKLSEAGLVSVRPQRGTYVVKISARQVYDVRFVREAVEVAVVRKAALELPESAIRALRETVNAQRRSEEHTYELQSLMRISYAVFCLKKKKKTKDQPHLQPQSTHYNH